MALRPERVQELVELMADALEEADLMPAVPDSMKPLLKLARLARMDPLAMLKDTVLGSLRGLPAAVEADPQRADRVAAWLIHCAAWLDGQTDQPPPSLGSSLGTG